MDRMNDAGASPADLFEHLREKGGRVLVCSGPGTDRLTPLRELVQQLAAAGQHYPCVTADLSLPPFGAPGAVNLGYWRDGQWHSEDCEPLCSLDSTRFRLPLITALERLLARHHSARLLLLAPGLARGVGGSELLTALIHRAGIDTVWWQLGADPVPSLRAELQACGVKVLLRETTGSRAISQERRMQQRGRLWRAHMRDAVAYTLLLDRVQVLGTAPPRNVASAWRGRQIALLHGGRCATLGEVTALQGDLLHTRVAIEPGLVEQLLIRDAISIDGLLQSARPYRKAPADPVPAPQTVGFAPDGEPLTKAAHCGPVPVARVGSATACLVNGVFGDPLLQLQLHHQRRSLLFDLGDPGRMTARTAHQVTDVFLSHTHADHIGGFMWFLRSRIGELPACRCYGPPGVGSQIAGMVNGILWDRVEERAPRFEVREWHGDHLKCYRVLAGKAVAQRTEDLPLVDGVVWREPAFAVRATALDHRATVLAYAYEPTAQLKVRRDRLQDLNLPSGRWLQEMKQAVLAGNLDRTVTLPDGSGVSVSRLQEQLLLVTPGQKLVYATDFADTPANRAQLVALARGAHSLFCEAPFMSKHRQQARRTQHLTTIACAEIASQAGVQHLLPFHFSKRYIRHAPEVYAEISSHCPQTVVPASCLARSAPAHRETSPPGDTAQRHK